MSWCLYSRVLPCPEARGDVFRQRFSLASRVLRGGWGDFARLGHVGNRGRIAGGEHVRKCPGTVRSVRTFNRPLSVGRSERLDQRCGGHPGHPRDGMGVDP